MMKLTYDSDVDAMSLFFRQETVMKSVEVSPYVIVHLDSEGCALKIELLGVSKFADAPEQIDLRGVIAATLSEKSS